MKEVADAVGRMLNECKMINGVYSKVRLYNNLKHLLYNRKDVLDLLEDFLETSKRIGHVRIEEVRSFTIVHFDSLELQVIRDLHYQSLSIGSVLILRNFLRSTDKIKKIFKLSNSIWNLFHRNLVFDANSNSKIVYLFVDGKVVRDESDDFFLRFVLSKPCQYLFFTSKDLNRAVDIISSLNFVRNLKLMLSLK